MSKDRLTNGPKGEASVKTEPSPEDKQKQETAKGRKPAKKAAKKPSPGLIELLLAKAQKFDGAALSEKIQEARDILGEPEAVKYFADLIGAADELGLQYLGFDQRKEFAQQEWFGLSLPEMKKKLKEWASAGDEVAREVLDNLGDFQKNAIVSDPLWQLVTDIVRPCRNVRNYGDLIAILRELKGRGLVRELVNPHRPPANGVTIRRGTTSFCYLPARKWGEKIPLAEAGWPFILQAQETVREWSQSQQRKLAALEKKATLTPSQVLAGENGTLFVQLGINRALLFEIRNRNAGREARVIETVGVAVGSLPSKWVDWEAEESAWPNQDVFHAVAAWKRRTRQGVTQE